MQPIFCPQCSDLILDQPFCLACGWQRPVAGGDVGAHIWQAELAHRLPKPRCGPVVAGGRYCAPTEDGAVVALDLASGERAWEGTLAEGSAALALATDGERIFVGCADTRPLPSPGKPFLALDARSGATAWEYPTGAHSYSAAMVDGDTVFFASSERQLYAVSATNGQKRWARAHPHWGPAAPAVGIPTDGGAGVVCAGGRGETLVAYAVVDGAELWRFTAGGWFAGELAIADGRVYALCWDGNLYALDLRTGRLLWKATGERDKGFMAPPVAASGRVFIGSRVYRANGEQREAAYAMLALQAADGAEQWRFYTNRHITAPSAVVGDTLLFGAEDGAFYALDLASGEQRWRIQLESRAVTQPLAAGDLAYIGERDGTVRAVRWRAQPAERLLSPDVYQSRGEHEQAAVAYALRGDLGAAAAIYENELGHRRQAAQLYERAGQAGKAAMLWEAEGELRRARDLYQVVGNVGGVARMLEGMGEPLQAAHAYEEAGALEDAARLYEQAGDRMRAAELYHGRGRFDQAAAIWESLGEWERVVEDLVAAQKPAEAAQILEQQGQLERAAELFETATALQQALTLRVRLEHWERAANLAGRVGDYAQAALAYERLGRLLPGAEAYECAAAQLAVAEPVDEAHVADLFERAAQLYGAALDEEHSAACRRQVRRYRHLPEIVVTGGAQQVFVEYEWNTLLIRVENIGHGPAHTIDIALHGPFDIRGNQTIAHLSPRRTETLEMFVRPHRDEYGPKVPLEIAVTYADAQSEHYQGTQRIPIHVVAKGAAMHPVTPLEIRVEDDQIRPEASRPEQFSVRAGAIAQKETTVASAEEIAQQESLLHTHRRTLAHYLRQRAQLGSAYVPPGVVHGIDEARAEIQRIKTVLRGWGVAVADAPDDSDAPAAAAPPGRQPQPVDRRALREAMVPVFSLEELATLCDDIQQDLAAAGVGLRVDLEEIGGSGKEGKIRELIGYLERRGYLSYLVDAVRKERPGII